MIVKYGYRRNRINPAYRWEKLNVFRVVKGFAMEDRLRNDDVRKELNNFSIHGRLQEYENNCKQHHSRIDIHRIPKEAFAYSLAGKRSLRED